MTYTAMILLILAILGGLVGFGNGSTYIGFAAQIISFAAGAGWAVLVIGPHVRRLIVAEDSDKI